MKVLIPGFPTKVQTYEMSFFKHKGFFFGVIPVGLLELFISVVLITNEAKQNNCFQFLFLRIYSEETYNFLKLFVYLEETH